MRERFLKRPNERYTKMDNKTVDALEKKIKDKAARMGINPNKIVVCTVTR